LKLGRKEAEEEEEKDKSHPKGMRKLHVKA